MIVNVKQTDNASGCRMLKLKSRAQTIIVVILQQRSAQEQTESNVYHIHL